MSTASRLPTGHTARSHARLLEDLTVAVRAHTLTPRWDPTRVSGTLDHGRGLLDAFALALHVLWTYDEAWADESSLSNALLPESVWNLLALVGYHRDPGSAAHGLQLVRVKDGVSAVLPPGFRFTAPASGEVPAASFETARAVTVSAALNELRPFLPATTPPPSEAGILAETVARLGDVEVPGLRPFADVLAGRFAANRVASQAARNAARARQRAQQVADTLAQLRDAGAPDICGDSYDALCDRLCALTAEAVSGPEGLGPLSESQELLAAQLRAMAQRQPTALAGLEAALRRADGEDDRQYSTRLDQLTGFLDALVSGLLQEARDQVVRLQGSRALTVLDERYAVAAAPRGIAPPGTDTLYLLPGRDEPGGGHHTQTGLLTPGDWLVLAEDPAPGAPAGTPRHYLEAVQVLQVRDERPPGLSEPVTRVTLTPPLRRRYDLARTVLAGNVVPISHGVGTTVIRTFQRDAGPVVALDAAPVTWLQAVDPGAEDGRIPQVEVRVAGRDWDRVRDLRTATPAQAVFAVEVDPRGRTRLRLGPGAPDRAELAVRYRTGLGAAGNRPAGAVCVIATAHPGLLSTLNPLPVTGGAEPEPADLSRARANRGIHALDRAVSLADVASLAETAAGVHRAAAVRDVVRRRDHVTVVAVGTGGRMLDADELDRLRSFLEHRMPPGATVRALPHRLVEVSARLDVRVRAGADPLIVLDAVRRRLGAADPAPGDRPGLLHPDRVDLGVDLHASDVYGALAGLDGVTSSHLHALHRSGGTIRPVLLGPATVDRALASVTAVGSSTGPVGLPTGRDLPPIALQSRPGTSPVRDRVEVPAGAIAAWAPDGLVLTWAEATS